MKLSLEELGRRTGESVDRLREWQSLGLIGAGSEPVFRPEDVERIRLIQIALRRGIGVEAIVKAEEAESGFLRRYLDQLFPGGVGPSYPLAEAAAAADLDPALVRRLWTIISPGRPADAIAEEDVRILRGWKIALDAGLPEEALMQVVRVYADSLARVAEAETRLFHFYVHERLKSAGVSGSELIRASEEASDRMRRLIEPAILYFHGKAMANALRDDMLMHLAEYAGVAEKGDAPGQLRLAVVFVDLASFTPLTEAMGDVAAAGIVQRFSELVREAVQVSHGRVVERIGDAFMLVFPDPRSAVVCALEIDRRAATEPQFPAIRSGVHYGPVLYREGGYVGASVNVASRVAGEAERHQVVVSATVRTAIGTLPDVEFVALGKRRLKGVAEEMELFEARPHAVAGKGKTVDPVCGMELAPAEVAARLSLEGVERAFCSEGCLRKFIEAPKTYGG